MKKTPSKAAHNRLKPFFFQYCQLAQIQPKSQFLFHKNLPQRDFSIMPLLTPWSRKSVWKTYSRMKNYPLLFPPFLTAWLWNTGEFVIYVYLLFPLNWTVWGCHSVALKLKVGFEFWNMSLNYNCRIKNNSIFFTFSFLS